ncbi:hypothetical protein A4A71_03530 [Nicoletella semolina]|uniref:YadA-like family protein n=1 Tax=Nicoletella semolina TaxID=271160 RepID=UPI0024474B0C|nr:YadA-like family protein [Nicoletella semolina]MDH2924437.1 hypothetical protein [Nicoletella semolina]
MKKQTFKKSLLALGVAGAMLGAVGNAGAFVIDQVLTEEDYKSLLEEFKQIDFEDTDGSFEKFLNNDQITGRDVLNAFDGFFIKQDLESYEVRKIMSDLHKDVTSNLNQYRKIADEKLRYLDGEVNSLEVRTTEQEELLDQHRKDLDHLGQVNGQQFALINTKADKDDLVKAQSDIKQHRTDLDALKNENAQQSALINTKADKDDLNALDKLTHTKASKTELEEAILAIEHNANNINETQFDLENVKQDVAEQQKTLVSINDEVVKIKDTNTQQDTRLNTVELKTDVLKLALDGKANKNEIDNQLAQKADKQATETALAKKADTSALAELSKQLDAKASKAVINNLEQRITQVDKTMSRGFATQAALSGLFQPYSLGKANVTAAVGGYKSESALAVGVGYRFDTNVAAKAGVAFNTRGGAATYNAAINYEW